MPITARRCKAYYANGAPPNWQENFISAYATSHPWEDFAETWAHYLHIVDTLEMARAFGMYVHPRLARPGELDAQVDFDPYSVRDPSSLIDTWIPLSNALNSLNRTMGLTDIYPFILSPGVVEKLCAMHDLIHGNSCRTRCPPRHSRRPSAHRKEACAGVAQGSATSRRSCIHC